MYTILVSLDGSALAEQILPYVGLLAQILGARVRLLRVIAKAEQTTLIADGAAMAYGADEGLLIQKEYVRWAWDMPSQHLADYLAAQAMQLRATGIGVDVAVCLGLPSARIVEHAARETDTLIALATRGHGGLRRWTLGSIADQVIQAVTTPIFLVRAGAPAPQGEHSFKRILVPLDGSALALAIALARGAQAELLLLRAVEPRTHFPALSTCNAHGRRRCYRPSRAAFNGWKCPLRR